VKLEREAIRLRHIRLRGLNMAQRVIRGFLGGFRESQVLFELVIGKADPTFGRDFRPQAADRAADVGRALPRQRELACLRLRQLRNPLRQHNFQESPNGAAREQEHQDGEDPGAPGDPSRRPED